MRRWWLGVAVFVAVCAQAGAGETRVWRIAGEALRARHYDTLEDCLREAPFIKVERFGASGLAYRVLSGAASGEDVLLVVDGVPWRDAWSGSNLYEELPLSLVESIEVDTDPQVVAYGDAAAGGVIRVATRRREVASVETRIHLTQGPWEERTRRVSFETPPGQIAVAVGLDEFIGDGYPFYYYWGGPDSPDYATPQIINSDRRCLAVRLDLDGGELGPVEFGLVQSEWHEDSLGEEMPRYAQRNTMLITAAMPATKWGAWNWRQTRIERTVSGWRALDTGLLLRWDSPRWRRHGRDLRLRAGGERHVPGYEREDWEGELPRPSRLWWAADAAGGLPAGLNLRAGGRLTARSERRRLINYSARLDWRGGSEGLSFGLFAAGGDTDPCWSRDRVEDHLLWPTGITAPAPEPVETVGRRAGVGMAWNRGAAWADLRLVREEDRGLWLPVRGGDYTLRWRLAELEPTHAVGLDCGTTLDGDLGLVDTRLSLLADLEERQYRIEEAHGGEAAADLLQTYPWVGSWRLRLSRPFFDSDARVAVGGDIEWRGGLEGRRGMWRVDLEAELRVIDARFWVKLENALDWSGEEIPGFPVPPISLRMGLDWHLDH